MDFDWETWSNLARSDPAAFEQRRKQAIETLIAAAPEHQRQRLNALQCRIDLERRRSTSPLGACIRMSNLMWERFEELRHALNVLGQRRSPDGTPIRVRRVGSAQVLAFPARR